MLSKKVIYCLVMVLVTLVIPTAAFSFGETEPVVIIDGKISSFDTDPFIEKGITFVPMRGVFEALGTAIIWDDLNQRVTASKNGINISLVVGNRNAIVNGKSVTLQAPAKIVKGRTYVPLRFVSESMGCTVQWENDVQAIYIITNNVKANITYKVGMDAYYEPFEYQTQNGEFQGFDVDLIRAIGKAEGFSVEFVNVPWEGLFTSLSNRSDLIINAITINAERKQFMSFSNPYINSRCTFTVPENSAIKSMSDLTGKRVAVQEGTLNEVVLETIGDVEIIRFSNLPDAVAALKNGQVDACAAESGIVQYYCLKYPDFKTRSFTDQSIPVEDFGIAVLKGNNVLLNKINNGLKKVIDSGEYDQIYSKWFGSKV